jgi:hypothetical protein
MAQTTEGIHLSTSQLMHVCHRWWWPLLLVAALLGGGGCRTANVVAPADAIVLEGTINPMLGPGGTVLCWVLEVGTDLRSLKYYALKGPEPIMARLRQADARAIVRAVIRTDVQLECPVGSVAEVYEILQLRSPHD